GASYRDVPAGPYHITVDSYGKDFNQDKDVQLAAGQELFVEIVSLRNWVPIGGGGGDAGGGSSGDFGRNTFYVWLIPAEKARAERLCGRRAGAGGSPLSGRARPPGGRGCRARPLLGGWGGRAAVA